MTAFQDKTTFRAPNLPLGALVDESGFPTPEFLTFLQTLVSSMQKNFGDEGLVAPTQTAANITTIQNNTQTVPTGSNYTCQFGTLIYDSNANTLRVALNDGAGAPTFKTITTS